MFVFFFTAQRRRDQDEEGHKKREQGGERQSKNQVRKWTGNDDHIVSCYSAQSAVDTKQTDKLTGLCTMLSNVDSPHPPLIFFFTLEALCVCFIHYQLMAFSTIIKCVRLST